MDIIGAHGALGGLFWAHKAVLTSQGPGLSAIREPLGPFLAEVLAKFGGFDDSGRLWPFGHFGLGEPKCGDMDVLAILADQTLLDLFGLLGVFDNSGRLDTFWHFGLGEPKCGDIPGHTKSFFYLFIYL